MLLGQSWGRIFWCWDDLELQILKNKFWLILSFSQIHPSLWLNSSFFTGSLCFNEVDVHFPDKTDQLEFESIKRNHTYSIVDLLSEKYLNNPTDIFPRLIHKKKVLNQKQQCFSSSSTIIEILRSLRLKNCDRCTCVK